MLSTPRNTVPAGTAPTGTAPSGRLPVQTKSPGWASAWDWASIRPARTRCWFDQNALVRTYLAMTLSPYRLPLLGMSRPYSLRISRPLGIGSDGMGIFLPLLEYRPWLPLFAIVR